MPIIATLVSYIYIYSLITYVDPSLSRPYIYSITYIFNPYMPPLGSYHVHLTPYMPPLGSYQYFAQSTNIFKKIYLGEEILIFY